jgi:chromosome partitioning protein
LRTAGNSIAVVSQKGGVGKTTLAANLAVSFQQLEFRTLLVEVDPQGSLLRLFGLDRYDLHHGLFGALTGEASDGGFIEPNLVEGLDLIPANVWSHMEEVQYLDVFRRDPTALRSVIAPFREKYDFIIMDCPPGLGSTTRAALTAADRYLVPVQAEAMNLTSLPRLQQLAETVREAHNPGLILDGYVVTMADTRTRHANQVIRSLKDSFGPAVFRTVIPRSIRVAEESAKGRPTVDGAPYTPAGLAFGTLTEEILTRQAGERTPEVEEPAERMVIGIGP